MLRRPAQFIRETLCAAAWPGDPSLDMTTPVREQVNNLDAANFFNRLAFLMKDNPPADADAPIIKKMARLGIVPGQPFRIDRFDPAVIQALQNLPRFAQARIMGWFKEGADYGTKEAVKDAPRKGSRKVPRPVPKPAPRPATRSPRTAGVLA